ncbi:hypothetical protein [Kineosporia sp. R_H_3]|uniref:baeRF3 domain-containing protein n=1 Tax=Kineosporia sp. R_H_3 TaxID=1961848 RepID=UPI000B4B2D28|nr:hypothetical protein [Kineosporia sp. R_H_3]
MPELTLVPPAAGAAWSPSPLTTGLVTLVQAVRGYPCVSLMMTTQPAPRMTPGDAARLERLRLHALGRLRTEGLESRTVVDALDRLVQEAVTAPTERGLALYASEALARSVRLPVEVEDRTVVDPSFATRDLVRALHRTPRHVVLSLSAHRAALFDGQAGRLAPVPGRHFPLDLRTLETPDLATSMRIVDRALGTHLRLHPAPLVVAGPERTVAAFTAVSRHTGRLAGVVHGAVEHSTLEDLAARTRPVLERYLLSRQDDALALLERRAGAHRVAAGIASAWLAARTERPEMLAVEEGYRFPARLSVDGDLVTPAEDTEAPDVIDDLVDELIETVLDRGGWVALVRDGALGGHERVALTVRR